MPFARPFRRAYLVFTYLIPVMLLILLWDGMVSRAGAVIRHSGLP
jgi:hypothetical protein